MADELNPRQRDELSPRQMWEIVNTLKELDKKYDATDKRIEGLAQAIDGVGQQPGIRQQLRELRHAVEGNPPAMRGVVIELRSINESHEHLRREFETFVDKQNKEGFTRQGAFSGAKFVWGLIAGAVLFLGTLAGLLVAIQNALSKGGG